MFKRMLPTSRCPYWGDDDEMLDPEDRDECDHDPKHGCKHCLADNGEWYCDLGAATCSVAVERPETW